MTQRTERTKDPQMKTYVIAADGLSITCIRCGRTSYNLKDVRFVYCGHCHIFHEDFAAGLPLIKDKLPDIPVDTIALIHGPGVWQDKNGIMHLSVPHILNHLGLEITPENQQILLQAWREVLAESHPDYKIEMRHLGTFPTDESPRDN